MAEMLIWNDYGGWENYKTDPDDPYSCLPRHCPRCHTSLRYNDNPHGIEDCIRALGEQVYEAAKRTSAP
jgi:hypothetical protein